MKFNEGDVVIITDSAREYKQKHIGKIGVIEQSFLTHDKIIMYGVRFENLQNLASRKGLFWFRAKSLSYSNSTYPETNESEEIPMFENYVVAKVLFPNDAAVFSYALYDPDVQVGDTVVVKTRNHGFAIADVFDIDINPEAKKEVTGGRQIVCRVDFTAYKARQEALKRASELQKQMDAKVREVQTLHIYEMFAEKDPALKAMLEEFKNLSNLISGKTDEQT